MPLFLVNTRAISTTSVSLCFTSVVDIDSVEMVAIHLSFAYLANSGLNIVSMLALNETGRVKTGI